MALQEAAHQAAGAAAEHGEEAGSFPPFDPALFASQLVWFALSFIALYVIMSRFVLPKVGATLAARAGTIEGDLDQAAQKSAQAENARVSMEKEVAKARADARAMVDAARAEVQAKLAAEQEAAEARIGERIRTAEARVDAAKQKALAEVPALADGLARDIAERIAPASTAAPRARVVGEA
jgi:F-type H+-transporting ATPase subunit b